MKATTIKKRTSSSFTGAVTRISYVLSSMIFIMSACVLIALNHVKPAMLDAAKASVIEVAAPAINMVNAPIQKSVLFIRDISGLATLQETNAVLQAENTRLKEWYLHAKALETENAELKAMLNVQNPNGAQRFITAQTIADTSSPFAKSMLVKFDKGAAIAKNAAVMSEQGLVGRVVEVGDQTARVLMVTDMNSRIPVVVRSGGRSLHAVLAGQNEARMKLLHIPLGTTLEPGATVTTSGHGNIYPRGLPVGVVADNGDYTVQAFMDPATLHFVKISVTEPVKTLASQ